MKLLNRTIVNFLIYSIIIILVGTPVFYLVIDRLFIEDVDEALLLRKQELQLRLDKKIIDQKGIDLWEDLDGDIRFYSSEGKVFKDSIYYTILFDSLANEMEPYRNLYTTILIDGKPKHAVIRISLVESEDLILAIVLTQAILLSILLVGLIIINWHVSKRIWKPFYDTLEKLRQFELDKNPAIQLSPSHIKEFQDLNRVINQLAEKNYKTFLNQKEFIENASHEMQTPLAVFQSTLELLIQSNHLSDEQARMIKSLLETTSRLTRLNKSLLLLSKIENNQFIETESVEITSLTEKLLNQFHNQLNQKAIKSHLDFNEEVTIRFNKTLIEIFLSNLISNAIRHNFENGEIEITITQNNWVIANTGPSLSIPTDKIFDRFQKGNKSTANIGLGLAIVKKICDTTGLTLLKYEFNGNRHIFSIGF